MAPLNSHTPVWAPGFTPVAITGGSLGRAIPHSCPSVQGPRRRYWAYALTSLPLPMMSDLRLSVASAHLDKSVMCVDYFVLTPGQVEKFRRQDRLLRGEHVMRALLQAYVHASHGDDGVPTIGDLRFIVESSLPATSPCLSSSGASPGQVAAWAKSCVPCKECRALKCAACGLHLERIIADGLVLQSMGDPHSRVALTFSHRCAGIRAGVTWLEPCRHGVGRPPDGRRRLMGRIPADMFHKYRYEGTPCDGCDEWLFEGLRSQGRQWPGWTRTGQRSVRLSNSPYFSRRCASASCV